MKPMINNLKTKQEKQKKEFDEKNENLNPPQFRSRNYNTPRGWKTTHNSPIKIIR